MDILSRYRDGVAQALAAALPEDGPLARLVRYPFGLSEADGRPGPGIGGKLLRPALTCFACEALEGEVEAAVPLAAAVELVHVFSLVHDDIQDGDRLRRGRPAAWVALGLPQAINAGDGLLALALRTVCAAGLPPEALVSAQQILVEATLAMIEGQALDLAMEGQPVGVDAYLDMARRKAGALLGGALALGAIAAGRADLAAGHLRTGEALGVAFQVRDDWLGLWGEPDRVGKPVGADLARGKRSFPIVWALERDPSLGEFLSEGEPAEALRRLVSLGTAEATGAAAERLLARAREMAWALPWHPWAHAAFDELCAGLAARVT
ncbi:MAG: polyprenyl synthetase family protein [Candidatus Bipolaricaulota bacterium]